MSHGNRRAWMCINASHCGGRVRRSALVRVVLDDRASAYADARVVRRGASARVRPGAVLLVPGVPAR